MPLESLLSQVSYAVQSAGGAIRQSECRRFLDWFEKTEDGTLTPKSVNFQLGEGHEDLTVPLAVLVNHNALGLSGVRLSLNVTAKESGGELMVSAAKPEEEGTPCHKLELEFGELSAAEGTARLLDVQNQFL